MEVGYPEVIRFWDMRIGKPQARVSTREDKFLFPGRHRVLFVVAAIGSADKLSETRWLILAFIRLRCVWNALAQSSAHLDRNLSVMKCRFVIVMMDGGGL